jgi:hypothetical protein
MTFISEQWLDFLYLKKLTKRDLIHFLFCSLYMIRKIYYSFIDPNVLYNRMQ